MSESASQIPTLEVALALHQDGKLAEAAVIYDSLLEQMPGHAEALHLSGLLLHQSGKSEAGLARIELAVQTDPTNGIYLYNRGVILQEAGRASEAVEMYRKCLGVSPSHVSAWVNLGNLLAEHGQLGEALDCHRNAAKLEPESEGHQARIAHDLRLIGDIEGALAILGFLVGRNPGNDAVWSSMLFASQYEGGIRRAELHQRHLRWGARFAPTAPSGKRSRKGPLKIGFLSPDLGNHPVGILVAPLLERLAKEDGVETICFNDRKGVDEYLIRNRTSSGRWHDVANLGDDELESAIRDVGLDVLIDLCGHGDQNRIRVLAAKPAPIQMTWAGYTGTTGLAAIDYLICDAFHASRGCESDYTEKLLRLPRNYVPWEAPGYAPDPGSPPLLEKGFATFGCFNNPTKLTAPTLALWARVLDRVPRSRLLLKYKGLHDPVVMQRVTGLLSVHGVSPDRIGFMGQTNHRDHLGAFAGVDVALDPTPYSGGVSTCEAIWMGVPVVTLPGETFASRHSLSHLSNAGVSDTIARDEDDYVRIAAELVADPDALANRRTTMRAKIADSPLLDLDSYSRDFLAAIRSVVD